MINQDSFDPTAGERARQIREHPDAPMPILDPTDPRYGQFPVGGPVRDGSGESGRGHVQRLRQRDPRIARPHQR